MDFYYEIDCNTASDFTSYLEIGYSDDGSLNNISRGTRVYRLEDSLIPKKEVHRIQSIMVPKKFGIIFYYRYHTPGAGFGLNRLTWSAFVNEI